MHTDLFDLQSPCIEQRSTLVHGQIGKLGKVLGSHDVTHGAEVIGKEIGIQGTSRE